MCSKSLEVSVAYSEAGVEDVKAKLAKAVSENTLLG